MAAIVALNDRRGFERSLQRRPIATTPHFVLHWVPTEKLSTEVEEPSALAVDNVRMIHLGMVIPRRHARRAVTRNAIRRQTRTVARDVAAELPEGTWIVRLRAALEGEPLGPAISSGSKRLVRGELQALFARAKLRSTHG